MSYSLADVTMACALYAGWDSLRSDPENNGYAAALYDEHGFGDVEVMRFMADVAVQVNTVIKAACDAGMLGVPEYDIGEPVGAELFRRAAEACDEPYYGTSMVAFTADLVRSLP